MRTCKAYLEIVPDLNDEQKKVILDRMKLARDAMLTDAAREIVAIFKRHRVKAEASAQFARSKLSSDVKRKKLQHLKNGGVDRSAAPVILLHRHHWTKRSNKRPEPMSVLRITTAHH
jgi:hypothetical protein